MLGNEEQALYETLARVQSAEDMRLLLNDLCTIKEIQSLAQRLQVAGMLWENQNYVAVAEKTGASSATISRVNRCLRYGAGGYRRVLEGRESRADG